MKKHLRRLKAASLRRTVCVEPPELREYANRDAFELAQWVGDVARLSSYAPGKPDPNEIPF